MRIAGFAKPNFANGDPKPNCKSPDVEIPKSLEIFQSSLSLSLHLPTKKKNNLLTTGDEKSHHPSGTGIRPPVARSFSSASASASASSSAARAAFFSSISSNPVANCYFKTAKRLLLLKLFQEVQLSPTKPKPTPSRMRRFCSSRVSSHSFTFTFFQILEMHRSGTSMWTGKNNSATICVFLVSSSCVCLHLHFSIF